MEELRAELQKQAVAVEVEMERELSHLAEKHEPKLLKVLRYGLLGGGKRVRPFLTMMAITLCGRRHEESLHLALAFEYLHGATLFHDDIIDQSKLRRGRAAVYQEFGTAAAILAGDFLLAHAMEIVAAHTGQPGLISFNRATRGMVDGEFWQLRNAQELNLSEQDYEKAVMRKTGLLIVSACEVGGLFGGASERELAALRCYGEGLGLAFQIVDDLLDYTGNSVKTGKVVGNDLQEGKMTLPLIYAMQNAEDAEKNRLHEILQNEELRSTENGLQEVISLIRKNSGFDLARQRAKMAVQEGVAALNVFSIQKEQQIKVKRLLAALGEFVLKREQ